jgi:hypothetical protein
MNTDSKQISLSPAALPMTRNRGRDYRKSWTPAK